MKNEIKKIILSMDNGVLKGLIVVRDNSVEKYDSNQFSNDQLLVKYSIFARELKSQFKSDISGLSNQEAIDKLYSNGKIEYNRNNLITNITVYDEGKSNERILIRYQNGRRIINIKDFLNINDYINSKSQIIKELCDPFGLDYNNLDNLKQIGVYRTKDTEKLVENVKEENKIRNLKIFNKRFLSGILSTAIIVTGIGVGVNQFSKKKNVKIINKPSIVSQIDSKFKIPDYMDSTISNMINNISNKNIVSNAKNLTKTLIDKISPIYSKDIYFENEDILFPNYLYANNKTNVAKKINGNYYYIGNSGYNGVLEKLNYIRKNNMMESNLDNNGVLIYYENLIDTLNVKEKAFVKYFSMIGNNIVISKNDQKSKNHNIIFATREAIRLIRDNEPLFFYNNGKKEVVYFKDLSIDTKNLILNIVGLNNIGMGDIKINYNNETITQYDIYLVIINEKDPRKNMDLYKNDEGIVDVEKYKVALEDWKNMILQINEYIANNIEPMELYDYIFTKKDHIKAYTDLQSKYITETYDSKTNPFRSRYSQGNSGYGKVNFEGKTIRKSGCGICAFSTGVSCALSKEYETNVSVNPKNLLKELKSLTTRHRYRGSGGLNWGSTSSNISIDITSAFKDISIIELKGKTPTFDQKTLEMITDNYPVVVSLNGRGHIVCVTSNNGNGKFYVADSDRGYSSAISIKTSIVRSDGQKKGTISGKKAWILVPNKNIKIVGNELKIEGLDLSELPSIGKFETNGMAYDIEIKNGKTFIVTEKENDKEISSGIKK